MIRSTPDPAPIADRQRAGHGVGVEGADGGMDEEPEPGLAAGPGALDELVVRRRPAEARW